MIRAENLCMSYGSVRALTDATFEVRQGEVLGLLGPNGAGKTTTLKILTTLLHPTSGTVTIDGIDASEDPIAVRRRIGYLPETAPLYVDMVVSDYLAFAGAARGLSGGTLRSRTDDVVVTCGLQPVFHRPIGELSKGFRQRVGLAQALIHDPAILILDEPTSGLDPLQILGIRDLVRSLAKRKTILFSTHILQEIEAVSDRVMIINAGRIIASGTPRELERQVMREARLIVMLDAPSAGIGEVLQAVEGVSEVDLFTTSLDERPVFIVAHAYGDAETPRRVYETVKARGWPLIQFTHRSASLEDVFVHLVREAVTETGKRGDA